MSTTEKAIPTSTRKQVNIRKGYVMVTRVPEKGKQAYSKLVRADKARRLIEREPANELNQQELSREFKLA